ncbi:hypothetical protein [Bacteroides sp.]
MENSKNKNKNFELRSEKVRSIVGQVPPILLRWGITIIGIVLLFLFTVSYYLPYKQIYSGEAVVKTVPEIDSDKIQLNILLKFTDRRPDEEVVKGSDIILNTSSPNGVMGKIISLSTVRDTLGRSEACIMVHKSSVKSLEQSEVNFILTQTSASLLEHFINMAK